MRVVIVGGGFGGVRAATRLAKNKDFEVKLISDHSYFEYHAALYRAATGRSPLEVAIPLTNFFKRTDNVEVIEDKIIKIESTKRYVQGESGSRYKYDVLILAVGSMTQYFGIKGLDKYAYGVKSIHEALALKRHLHEELTNNADGQTNYVVIGGGATGVELAAELLAYVRRIQRRHRLADRPFRVMLVEAADRLLPGLPERFSAKIFRRVRQLGVDIRLKTKVEGESHDQLNLPEGDVSTHSVVWTAGITNNPLFASHPQLFKLGKGQKVQVDPQLQATPGIYVIGDSAATPFSGMAQTALGDADLVTTNLKRQLRRQPPLTYRLKRPIYAIPVGPRWSAVLWDKIQIFGYPGWLIRRWLDLKLYLKFLPFTKAWGTWRQGSHISETCADCD